MPSPKHPKISIYISMSMDGFIAREDGSLDWLNCVVGDQEDYGFKNFLADIDGVILGRKTYEVAVTAYGTEQWPYAGKKMVVLSHSLQEVIDEAQVYSGDLTNLLKLFEKEGVKHVWVDGGVTISQFLNLNVVDEMTLLTIPMLLGSGIPLFDVNQEVSCHLITSKSYPSGLVQAKYRLAKQME